MATQYAVKDSLRNIWLDLFKKYSMPANKKHWQCSKNVDSFDISSTNLTLFLQEIQEQQASFHKLE